MENASKALIIAGAILLSILLISLGIMIFNQAQSVVDGTGMTDAEITTFNSKFQKYETASGIKGSLVKSMINDIIAVNKDDNEENNIKLTAGSVTGASISSTGWIKTNTTYYVTFSYGDSGKINEVKITTSATTTPPAGT